MGKNDTDKMPIDDDVNTRANAGPTGDSPKSPGPRIPQATNGRFEAPSAKRLQFGKNAVAAIALAASIVVTWMVVQALRKPGSMSVIEAQSMDMSTMLPPLGAVPVELARVENGPIEGSVTYTGTVQAYDDEDVYPRITGRITRMPVYPGDQVRKGQLLVLLDPPEDSEYLAKLQEAKYDAFSELHDAEAEKEVYDEVQHDLQAAQAAEQAAQEALDDEKSKLIYWQPEIQREEKLLKKQVISQQEYDQELSQYKSDDARVAEGQAKLTEATQRRFAAEAATRAAKHHLGHRFAMADKAKAAELDAAIYNNYRQIVAREDAVVAKRLISPGVLVNPGTMILKLAHIKQVRLQAEVASSDASKIRVGNPVYIRKDATDAEETKARVTSIFPSADPSTRTFVVEALVDNLVSPKPLTVRDANHQHRLEGINDYRFLPGQYVVMRISTGETSGLSVPTSAIIWKEAKAEVWKAVDSTGGSTKYSCLMHPEVRSDKPGNCPKCGMKLEPTKRGGPQTAALVGVTTGLSDGERTQVIDGLHEGDQVVASGYANLQPGMPIIGTPWGNQGPTTLPSGGQTATGRLDSANNWTLTKTVDDIVLTFSLSPTPPQGGNNSLVIKVARSDGTSLGHADITAKTSMPTMSMPGPDLTARQNGAGTYEMKGDFMSGLWKIETSTTVKGESHPATIEVEVP